MVALFSQSKNGRVISNDRFKEAIIGCYETCRLSPRTLSAFLYSIESAVNQLQNSNFATMLYEILQNRGTIIHS